MKIQEIAEIQKGKILQYFNNHIEFLSTQTPEKDANGKDIITQEEITGLSDFWKKVRQQILDGNISEIFQNVGSIKNTLILVKSIVSRGITTSKLLIDSVKSLTFWQAQPDSPEKVQNIDTYSKQIASQIADFNDIAKQVEALELDITD